MARLRTLARFVCALVLTVAPVLRSACDLECAAPAPKPAASSHCGQHPDAQGAERPSSNDDDCGHDHQSARVTAARTIHAHAGLAVAALPSMAALPFDGQHVIRIPLASVAPPARYVTPPVPLRI